MFSAQSFTAISDCLSGIYRCFKHLYQAYFSCFALLIALILPFSCEIIVSSSPTSAEIGTKVHHTVTTSVATLLRYFSSACPSEVAVTASSLFSSKQLKWEYSELKTGTAMILEGVWGQLVKTNNEQKVITKGFILNLSSREIIIQKIERKLIYE